MSTKSKVSYVVVNRAEGPTEECGAVLFYSGDVVPVDYDDKSGHYRGAVPVKCAAIMDEVQKQFTKWGHSAPDDDCYDKCDFKVVWENGESYEGRYDLQKGGTDGKEYFVQSLKNRVGFYACVRRPSHFNDKDWASHCARAESEGWKAETEKFINECEM